MSVGRDRSGLFDPAVREYAGRIDRYLRCELCEVSEDAKVLKQIQRADRVVALDERGKQLSSEELARWLQQAMMDGRDLVFVIGGAEGLTQQIRERADMMLSLSKMTYAHRLARVMLAEQIYRAFTILRGEPYHK